VQYADGDILSVVYIVPVGMTRYIPASLVLQFLDFVRVNFIVKLSKNLPPRLVGLDDKWPHPPVALTEVQVAVQSPVTST